MKFPHNVVLPCCEEIPSQQRHCWLQGNFLTTRSYRIVGKCPCNSNIIGRKEISSQRGLTVLWGNVLATATLLVARKFPHNLVLPYCGEISSRCVLPLCEEISSQPSVAVVRIFPHNAVRQRCEEISSSDGHTTGMRKFPCDPQCRCCKDISPQRGKTTL